MIYDLSIESNVIEFKARCVHLIEKKNKVELKLKRKQRTVSQNKYLHVILTYAALQLGYTLDEFKVILKTIICKDDFEYSKKKFKFYKSTSELDTLQMTLVIEKFRNYMMANFQMYIAAPNEHLLIEQLESEISRYGNKQYL